MLAYTIAAEIGDITRFSTPDKLVGYTGLCPRVIQSGEKDRRGPLTKSGPKYLRWAMLEATMHAFRHPAYAERYQRTKRRPGKQRGAKVAQIDIARRLTRSVWHMLTYGQPFHPRPLPEAPLFVWPHRRPFWTCVHAAGPPTSPGRSPRGRQRHERRSTPTRRHDGDRLTRLLTAPRLS